MKLTIKIYGQLSALLSYLIAMPRSFSTYCIWQWLYFWPAIHSGIENVSNFSFLESRTGFVMPQKSNYSIEEAIKNCLRHLFNSLFGGTYFFCYVLSIRFILTHYVDHFVLHTITGVVKTNWYYSAKLMLYTCILIN